MLLSNKEIQFLNAGLGELDGTKKGNDFATYKLDGKTMYAIVKNKKNLRDAIEAAEEIRKKLVLKYSDDGLAVAPNSKKQQEFLQEWTTIMKEQTEVTIHLFDVKGLRLRPEGDIKAEDDGKYNDIPPSLLEALLPALTGLEAF